MGPDTAELETSSQLNSGLVARRSRWLKQCADHLLSSVIVQQANHANRYVINDDLRKVGTIRGAWSLARPGG